uniref:VWFA domain-containing protein n=1 Tax=Mycena chlorophos TaxID=658473 RepID=A0ABQ0KX77_MYCCL|nr:predicted protein [Mycena chlorophos]
MKLVRSGPRSRFRTQPPRMGDCMRRPRRHLHNGAVEQEEKGQALTKETPPTKVALAYLTPTSWVLVWACDDVLAPQRRLRSFFARDNIAMPPTRRLGRGRGGCTSPGRDRRSKRLFVMCSSRRPQIAPCRSLTGKLQAPNSPVSGYARAAPCRSDQLFNACCAAFGSALDVVVGRRFKAVRNCKPAWPAVWLPPKLSGSMLQMIQERSLSTARDMLCPCRRWSTAPYLIPPSLTRHSSPFCSRELSATRTRPCWPDSQAALRERRVCSCHRGCLRPVCMVLSGVRASAEPPVVLDEALVDPWTTYQVGPALAPLVLVCGTWLRSSPSASSIQDIAAALWSTKTFLSTKGSDGSSRASRLSLSVTDGRRSAYAPGASVRGAKALVARGVGLRLSGRILLDICNAVRPYNRVGVLTFATSRVVAIVYEQPGPRRLATFAGT